MMSAKCLSVDERVAPLRQSVPGVRMGAGSSSGTRHRSAVFVHLPDLVRQRQLRDVQPFGSAGEVQGFGDGVEVADVAQFHKNSRNQSLMTSMVRVEINHFRYAA